MIWSKIRAECSHFRFVLDTSDTNGRYDRDRKKVAVDDNRSIHFQNVYGEYKSYTWRKYQSMLNAFK